MVLIALDPGHNCSPDIGAVGFEREDRLNLSVCNALTPMLEGAGHQVFSVLPSSCSSVSQSLKARVDKANRKKAGLYVSIHFNAFNGKAQGTEVFAVSAVGRQYANAVVNEIADLGFTNRGVKDGSDLYVLTNTQMPAILVECCFVDHKGDMNLFDPTEMAEAIARGIIAIAGGTLPSQNRSQPTAVRIKVDTVLKQTTQQSSEITDPRAKISVRAGKTLKIGKQWAEKEGHVQIELKNPVNNFRRWWGYAGHLTLLAGDRPLVVPNAPGGPQIERSTPPDPQIKKPSGQVIQLPGRSVDLNASIIEGGWFYWWEALHGGTRIPKTKQEIQNIITLATWLKRHRVRERLGNVPIIVTSWFRPDPWNRQAGGAPNSFHKSGLAFDFLRPGLTGRQIAARLSDWPGGMGIYSHYPNLCHLDARAYRARWGGI